MRRSVKSNNPEKNSGFTLIELLLVAAITAIIGLAVISVFSAGLRAYYRVHTADKSKLDAYLFFEEFEFDLRNVSAFSEIGFEGEAEKLSFAGWFNGKRAFGRVTYEVEPNNKKISKVQEPYIPRGDKSSRVIALTGFRSLQFSYGSANLSGPKPKWEKRFVPESGIPKAVKVDLSFECEGVPVHWTRILTIPSAENAK